MVVGFGLCVGIAQIGCDLGDFQAYVDRHVTFIDHAAESGADLLLFPELSLTGNRLGGCVVEVTRTRDDPLVTSIAAVAPEMTVVFGMVEEGKLFANGNYDETFATGKPWRDCVLICADLWNPAVVHLSMLHGTTLLLLPVNSALEAVGGDFSNPDQWQLAVRFYAMMYGMPIVMANRVCVENGATVWGAPASSIRKGRCSPRLIRPRRSLSQGSMSKTCGWRVFICPRSATQYRSGAPRNGPPARSRCRADLRARSLVP